MDKRTMIMIAALVVILLFWGKIVEYLGFAPSPPPPPAVDSTTTQIHDSLIVIDTVQTPATIAPDTSAPTMVAMAIDTTIPGKTILVTTPLYEMTFSTRGGGIKKIILKNFIYKTGGNIVLADDPNLSVPDFETADRTYRTSRLSFQCEQNDTEIAKGSAPKALVFTHDNGKGGRIVKRYTINPDRYDFDLSVTVEGIETFGFDRSYNLVWDITPRPTEENLTDDYGYYKVVAMMSGDHVEVAEFKEGKLLEELPGSTTWSGIRTKYFAAVMIPRSRPAEGMLARGKEIPVLAGREEVKARELSAALSLPISNSGSVTDSFTIYAGPIHYKTLTDYNIGLEELTSLGWKIIKPFSIAIIWLLPKIYSVVPNYGVVVLVFALIVKLLIFPLSKKQTVAMAKMRDLQPKMKALQEKHKNDAAKLNKEMMKLYKEAGANPFSGCLMMLPQMPLFFALFSVFRTTIEFRGASFLFWITDLSLADPYYILPIIMTVFMFLQQRLTMTDPKNKMLNYILPLVFGWMFMNFPAGLTLYWTGFNILSFVETTYFRKPPEPDVVVLDEKKS